MADYCKKCGRPLPQSGVCACTASHPKRHGNGIQDAVRFLPGLWLSYLKDPVGTARRASERRDSVSGLVVMLSTIAVSFLSVFLFTLRYAADRFARAALQWIATGLLAPLLAFLLSFALMYMLTAAAKMRVDVRSVVAAIGVNAIYPLTMLTASLLLSLFSMSIFNLFTVLAFASWLIGFIIMNTEVFSVKPTPVTCAMMLVGMTAGYYIVSLLREWLLSVLF